MYSNYAKNKTERRTILQKQSNGKRKLIITVEASKNHCGAYAANVDGLRGAGDSIPECKAGISKSIEEILAEPASQD